MTVGRVAHKWRTVRNGKRKYFQMWYGNRWRKFTEVAKILGWPYDKLSHRVRAGLPLDVENLNGTRGGRPPAPNSFNADFHGLQRFYLGKLHSGQDPASRDSCKASV